MSIIDYLEDKLRDPVDLGIFLICAVPVVFTFSYFLGYYFDHNFIFLTGIFICGLMSFIPIKLLTILFLLLKNPAKYKEREMKILTEKMEEQRRIYLLIMISILQIKTQAADKSLGN